MRNVVRCSGPAKPSAPAHLDQADRVTDFRRRRPEDFVQGPQGLSLMQRRQLGPARFDWSEQLIFDLLLDRLQPTFGAPGAALEVLDFAFELLDAILRGSELY
jgi:hypothetical protein